MKEPHEWVLMPIDERQSASGMNIVPKYYHERYTQFSGPVVSVPSSSPIPVQGQMFLCFISASKSRLDSITSNNDVVVLGSQSPNTLQDGIDVFNQTYGDDITETEFKGYHYID